MEFGPGFWVPIIATASMLLIAGVAYLILRTTRRITPLKPGAQKLVTYACGDESKPEEIHADSEQFLSSIRRIFRSFYRYIQHTHTGTLNTYLFWLVAGFIIIFVVILLILG